LNTRYSTVGRLFSIGARSVTIAIAGLMLVTGRAADIDHGQGLFNEHCSACHTIIAAVRDKSGPNLNGLFGRRAGTEDYSAGYSDEMAASGVTWDVATLQAFLNSPALMVRGTKMVFRGLPDFEARLDLACYLERTTREGDAPPNDLCVEETRD
jgi:cytochrome c